MIVEAFRQVAVDSRDATNAEFAHEFYFGLGIGRSRINLNKLCFRFYSKRS